MKIIFDGVLHHSLQVLSTFYDTSQALKQLATLAECEVFNPLWLIDRPQADVCHTAIFTLGP